MNSDSHVDLLSSIDVELTDSDNHFQAHFNGPLRMIITRFRTSCYTIIAVTQSADLLQTTDTAQVIESEEK